MATTLKLTRDQLATFLKDFEQIKQFERLFSIADQVAENPDTQSISIAAESALAAANLALDESGNTDAQISAAIAETKANEALSLVSAVQNALQLLQLAPVDAPPKRTRYGQFLDTTTQTAAVIDTAYPITYNTTDLSHGVFLTSSSEIEVDTEGVYNFQFSIQLDKTSGGIANFWIWPRVNGADVANSCSQIRIQGNDAEIFSAANFFLDLAAGDLVQFMWAASDTSVEITSFAASAFAPAIPSIIVTVSNNIRTY